jgi:hypothetical protein
MSSYENRSQDTVALMVGLCISSSSSSSSK